MHTPSSYLLLVPLLSSHSESIRNQQAGEQKLPPVGSSGLMALAVRQRMGTRPSSSNNHSLVSSPLTSSPKPSQPIGRWYYFPNQRSIPLLKTFCLKLRRQAIQIVMNSIFAEASSPDSFGTAFFPPFFTHIKKGVP